MLRRRWRQVCVRSRDLPHTKQRDRRDVGAMLARQALRAHASAASCLSTSSKSGLRFGFGPLRCSCGSAALSSASGDLAVERGEQSIRVQRCKKNEHVDDLAGAARHGAIVLDHVGDIEAPRIASRRDDADLDAADDKRCDDLIRWSIGVSSTCIHPT
jgi:hypothetical protein